jgi:hypothetical protein
MMRTALMIGTALWALTLAGCDIYFGPSGSSDCSAWGTCDQDTWPPNAGPAQPGEACFNNFECAAGCACVEGQCVETGFCDAAWDCAGGMECEMDRATCIPEGSNGSCTADGQCPNGSYCDAAAGFCIPSWGCNTNADCGVGWECNADGTCIPMPCAADGDCFEGCACETDTGVCQETGFCETDADCAPWCDEAGNCTNLECDEDRGTCTWPVSQPPPPPPVSCSGTITCSEGAPVCPTGETAAISDGCYTGSCIAVADCDVPPLATCDRIQNVNQCISRTDCEAVWTGENCSCNDGGTACDCNANPAACTCESYEYACRSL